VLKGGVLGAQVIATTSWAAKAERLKALGAGRSTSPSNSTL